MTVSLPLDAVEISSGGGGSRVDRISVHASGANLTKDEINRGISVFFSPVAVLASNRRRRCRGSR